MKTLLFVIGLTLVGNAGATGLSENRLIYHDDVAREMLIEALKTKNIPYRVDPAGGVWYPANHEKTVDAIGRRIVLERFSGLGVSFEDTSDVTSFRSKLTEAGIPYKAKLQYDRDWTTWEKADDLRAREIQEKVETENMERSRVSREKRKSQQ